MKRIRSCPTVLALGWTLIVIVSLVLPGSSVPQTDILEYDKAIHALLFGVGVFLWLRVPRSSKTARWVIVLGALAFAPVSEMIQAILGMGRSADPWDAVADVTGVILGVAVWLLRRHWTRPNGPGTADSGDPDS